MACLLDSLVVKNDTNSGDFKCSFFSLCLKDVSMCGLCRILQKYVQVISLEVGVPTTEKVFIALSGLENNNKLRRKHLNSDAPAILKNIFFSPVFSLCFFLHSPFC